MSLKLIPTENPAKAEIGKSKNFNPGKIKKILDAKEKDFSLKTMCISLVHYINRGGKFTCEQIDEIIIGLHRSILKLQKKKQEILKKKK